MPATMPLAYMIATSFSGSTLLSLLLDSHPDLASVGEVDNSVGESMRAGRHEEFPCSCGEKIRRCPFWTDVQARLAAEGVELDLHDFRTRLGESLPVPLRRFVFGAPARLHRVRRLRDWLLTAVPAYRRHVEDVMTRADAIARATLDITGKPVFVDASKAAVRAHFLIDRPGLDLRILHLVRDPRGYVKSARNRNPDWTAESLAPVWMRVHGSALSIIESLPPDRVLTLRWEDFCRDPKQSLNQVCDFLGVPHFDMLAAVNEQPHHVMGNRMRLKPVGAIRYDESWREVLSPEDIAACERIAGPLMERFGYLD